MTIRRLHTASEDGRARPETDTTRRRRTRNVGTTRSAPQRMTQHMCCHHSVLGRKEDAGTLTWGSLDSMDDTWSGCDSDENQPGTLRKVLESTEGWSTDARTEDNHTTTHPDWEALDAPDDVTKMAAQSRRSVRHSRSLPIREQPRCWQRRPARRGTEPDHRRDPWQEPSTAQRAATSCRAEERRIYRGRLRKERQGQ